MVFSELSVVGNCGCARCLRTYSRRQYFVPHYSICRRLARYNPLRGLVDSAFEGCAFRLKRKTAFILNRSNTSTRMHSRNDWTNLRAQNAHAARIAPEGKNAGRRHVNFWNDYHVGNSDAGGGSTCGGVGNLVGKSLICRATVLAILQQNNRRGAGDSSRSRMGGPTDQMQRRQLSLDRNGQKQEQCWQNVCPHCIGKC
ncbi:hypothetical protein B9Z19DRAFT_1156182 [Tuber borchii]|uniref:Uncharacterized protein n=1 Tax=Tuber borchii TaxID=42251 RepID=A0A2T6ZHB6_TUBBO|nr:hypothetical protein B9Z19DRAFT_1156182 [Tuber borchii]